MPQIKICGLVTKEDAALVNKNLADYAGIVMFYPKSKRNCNLEMAESLLKNLDSRIKTVAVTVSPSKDQAEQINQMGFDYIQIHGELKEETSAYFDQLGIADKLQIFRAINVEDDDREKIGTHIIKDMVWKENTGHPRIVAYVLDGKNSGSGKSFDWSMAENLNTGGRMLMLAGGLNSENVLEAINKVRPDIVDVSTGVELDQGIGKDEKKVMQFIRKVRSYE